MSYFCWSNIPNSVTFSSGEFSLCAGIFNRTTMSVSKCDAVFGDFQNFLFPTDLISPMPLVGIRSSSLNADGGGDEPSSSTPIQHTIRVTVSTVLSVAALMQLLSGLILTLYSAARSGLKLSINQWQAIIHKNVNLICNCNLFVRQYSVSSLCFFPTSIPPTVVSSSISTSFVWWHAFA